MAKENTELQDQVAGLQLELEAEKAAHAETAAQLEAEKAAHAGTQATLAAAEGTIESLKAQVATVVEAKPVAKKKPEVVTEPFSFNDKKYQLLVAQVNIPGVGVRTASEIVLDEEDTDGVKKFLVESESGVIREVL